MNHGLAIPKFLSVYSRLIKEVNALGIAGEERSHYWWKESQFCGVGSELEVSVQTPGF